MGGIRDMAVPHEIDFAQGRTHLGRTVVLAIEKLNEIIEVVNESPCDTNPPLVGFAVNDAQPGQKVKLVQIMGEEELRTRLASLGWFNGYLTVEQFRERAEVIAESYLALARHASGGD